IKKVLYAKNHFQRFGLSGDSRRLFWNYIAGELSQGQDDEKHLSAVMNWLATAQDVHDGEGVSACFYLDRGWDVPYPETSGYIISTFLTYATNWNKPDFRRRA